MRMRISDRLVLLITYLALFLVFWQAQSVAGPFEQSIRARIAQPSAHQATHP